MREILFRGLHRRKGEKVRLDGSPVESVWVYGGYCQYNEERGIIYQTTPDIHKYPVYAETVGQYTGLQDKNGKRIFEGDILKNVFGEYGIVEYSDNFFYVRKAMVNDYSPECFSSSKVVGNIYDNPELVREKRLDWRK